MVKKQVST